MTPNTMTMYRGEGAVFNFAVVDSNGAAYDLTGVTLKFAVRHGIPAGSVASDADAIIRASTVTNEGITVTGSPTAGTFELVIESAATYALTPFANAPYGIEATWVDETSPIVVDQGTFTLLGDIVRS